QRHESVQLALVPAGGYETTWCLPAAARLGPEGRAAALRDRIHDAIEHHGPAVRACLPAIADEHWADHLQVLTSLREVSRFSAWLRGDPAEEDRRAANRSYATFVHELRLALLRCLVDEVPPAVLPRRPRQARYLRGREEVCRAPRLLPGSRAR
ncbi:hypothetical protein, partial [Crossiella equi]|uniref:hypothetical protein n=1 Tax=Crossiella equi TaxID=130796 RepID=UPI001B8063DC